MNPIWMEYLSAIMTDNNDYQIRILVHEGTG